MSEIIEHDKQDCGNELRKKGGWSKEKVVDVKRMGWIVVVTAWIILFEYLYSFYILFLLIDCYVIILKKSNIVINKFDNFERKNVKYMFPPFDCFSLTKDGVLFSKFSNTVLW